MVVGHEWNLVEHLVEELAPALVAAALIRMDAMDTVGRADASMTDAVFASVNAELMDVGVVVLQEGGNVVEVVHSSLEELEVHFA